MAKRRTMECKHFGCYNLTENKCGYCDEHLKEFEDKEKERRKKLYNTSGKDNIFNKFYWSKKWKDKRNYILFRDNYLCQDCLKNNKITEATDVHHIIKLRLAWDKRYDDDNLISLCNDCHKKRDRER